LVSRGSPEKDAEDTANTIGNVPTSKVHWLTLLESNAPSDSEAFRRDAYKQATISSGEPSWPVERLLI
jgi:hypothetical protein